MKKTRRRYDRAFKISVVAELESGKPLAQIARKHAIDWPFHIRSTHGSPFNACSPLYEREMEW